MSRCYSSAFVESPWTATHSPRLDSRTFALTRRTERGLLEAVPIQIRRGDVLEAKAECLILTVSPDSVTDLMDEDRSDRVLGNVGQQFRRRWPYSWDTIRESADVAQPGRARLIELGEGHPFLSIGLLFTLSHSAKQDLANLAGRKMPTSLRHAAGEFTVARSRSSFCLLAG